CGRTRLALRWFRIGSAKAAVLPVPVWAMPMTSRLASSNGMVWAWIGVGVTYFSSERARRIGSARPKSLKEFNSKSFYVRPDRLARMRAESERGVRDIPREKGCQMREMSENGAENLRREQFPRKELRRDRLSRGPETAWRIKPLFRPAVHGRLLRRFQGLSPGAGFSRRLVLTGGACGGEVTDRPVDRLLNARPTA
ncbi:MAG: hypothetical protein QOF09_347, partial [Alphaproteobacteria bacterium]|nr:hypothetical protein [Alphaproteobacteria bacterium]